MFAPSLRVLEIGYAVKYGRASAASDARAMDPSRPQVFSFVNVEVKNRGISTGWSSDTVCTQRLDKKICDVLLGAGESLKISLETARNAYLDSPIPDTAFGLHCLAAEKVRLASTASPVEQALAGVICSGIDKAILDAVLKAFDMSFFEGMARNIAGIDNRTAPALSNHVIETFLLDRGTPQSIGWSESPHAQRDDLAVQYTASEANEADRPVQGEDQFAGLSEATDWSNANSSREHEDEQPSYLAEVVAGAVSRQAGGSGSNSHQGQAMPTLRHKPKRLATGRRSHGGATVVGFPSRQNEDKASASPRRRNDLYEMVLDAALDASAMKALPPAWHPTERPASTIDLFARQDALASCFLANIDATASEWDDGGRSEIHADAPGFASHGVPFPESLTWLD